MDLRRTLRIVHLSDLHIGKEPKSAWRKRRVLGEAWTRNLQDIAADGPVDLVCFTGDLAQSGQAGQYTEATAFVDEVLSILKVPKTRFFCVPGNHDVDRKIEEPAWKEMRQGTWEINPQVYSRWMADAAKPPRGFDADWPDAVVARQAAYRQWLVSYGRECLLPSKDRHARLGYRVTLDLGLEAPLHIVGLDSAWLAGDDHDNGNLRLTDEQVGRLLTENGAPLPGWSIALVHHPLTDLADGREAQRLLTEYGVSLLLHGHLHDPEIFRWITPATSLHVSAAGSLYEHDRYPNSLQVLDLHLPERQPVEPRRLWARTWSARGHWHNDDSLYPGSVAGKLALVAVTEPDTPFTPGEFIGREAELDQLRRALLPEYGRPTRPTVLCCSIEGMAGVGKTRLAEHFIQAYWLPALGLPADADPASAHLRLTLDPLASTPPTAKVLGQQLADRLRNTGPPGTLWSRLVASLTAGPHGQPWLLLIENVDSEGQARAVGELVNHLPGCPILVTARFQKLGGTDWVRVPVAPMSARDARDLLLSETRGQDGHPLTPDEANDLAQRLGRLPLALHIAASHLNLGLTPKAFLAELSQAGLDLPPASPGDPRLSADRARAIVHSSFELSWRHWCTGQGGNPAWQQALVALAHGPIGPTGLWLSVAITALDEDTYPAFAVAAARLSLLQYAPASRHSQLHPLIAEFLRARPVPEASVVRDRMSGWFMPRLPKTGDAAQGTAWREILAESDALGHWLSVLPLADGLSAEHIGQDFAVSVGPFGFWQRFCERLITEVPDAPEHLSSLYWTLSQVTRQGGDPVRSIQAAETKAGIDRQRGDEREFALARGVVADVLQARGHLDEALRIRRDDVLPVFDKLGDMRERAVTLGQIADVLQVRGQLDEALRIRREEILPVFDQLGDVRERAVTMGKIADVLQARGQLDEALRIRREEELPVYDQVGDARARAVTKGQIADVHQARGQFAEALRIRRDEVLPVLEQLGDVRERAVTLGKIADLLHAREQLDEALRIRRDEVLPVFEQLGDVRERAVTMGRIADVLQARGQHDEALRIRREEELPVYDKLGEVGARAVTMGKIAAMLQARGQLDEAMRIRREEELPVYSQLGDVGALLVGRTNLAIGLAIRGLGKDKPEIMALLRCAYADALRMDLPEAGQIAIIFNNIFHISIN